jgi:hypothetical protein
MDNAKRTDEERKTAQRLIYINLRLAELKDEMERLRTERETLREQRGAQAAGAKKAAATD